MIKNLFRRRFCHLLEGDTPGGFLGSFKTFVSMPYSPTIPKYRFAIFFVNFLFYCLDDFLLGSIAMHARQIGPCDTAPQALKSTIWGIASETVGYPQT